MDRSNFMTNYFSRLPNDLQNKIFCEHAKLIIPKPEFLEGAFVRYTKEYRDKLSNKFAPDELDHAIWSILIIKDDPIWDDVLEKYKYDFIS